MIIFKTKKNISLLSRLENGLYILQMIDYMIVDLAYNGEESLKQHIFKTLKMRRLNLDQIANVVREYANELVPLPEENPRDLKKTTDEPEIKDGRSDIDTTKQKKFANAELVSSKTLKYVEYFCT